MNEESPFKVYELTGSKGDKVHMAVIDGKLFVEPVGLNPLVFYTSSEPRLSIDGVGYIPAFEIVEFLPELKELIEKFAGEFGAKWQWERLGGF